MPGIFPDYAAPIVRNRADVTELTLARWGMPSSQYKACRSHCRPRQTSCRRHHTDPRMRRVHYVDDGDLLRAKPTGSRAVCRVRATLGQGVAQFLSTPSGSKRLRDKCISCALIVTATRVRPIPLAMSSGGNVPANTRSMAVSSSVQRRWIMAIFTSWCWPQLSHASARPMTRRRMYRRANGIHFLVAVDVIPVSGTNSICRN